MKLWLLTVEDESISCSTDVYDGKVIRAVSPSEARKVANEHVSDEGEIWQDVTKVSCKQIKEDGQPKVVLESFNAG
jgi:hypothetical protein